MDLEQAEGRDPIVGSRSIVEIGRRRQAERLELLRRVTVDDHRSGVAAERDERNEPQQVTEAARRGARLCERRTGREAESAATEEHDQNQQYGAKVGHGALPPSGVPRQGGRCRDDTRTGRCVEERQRTPAPSSYRFDDAGAPRVPERRGRGCVLVRRVGRRSSSLVGVEMRHSRFARMPGQGGLRGDDSRAIMPHRSLRPRRYRCGSATNAGDEERGG